VREHRWRVEWIARRYGPDILAPNLPLPTRGNRELRTSTRTIVLHARRFISQVEHVTFVAVFDRNFYHCPAILYISPYASNHFPRMLRTRFQHSRIYGYSARIFCYLHAVFVRPLYYATNKYVAYRQIISTIRAMTSYIHAEKIRAEIAFPATCV